MRFSIRAMVWSGVLSVLAMSGPAIAAGEGLPASNPVTPRRTAIATNAWVQMLATPIPYPLEVLGIVPAVGTEAVDETWGEKLRRFKQVVEEQYARQQAAKGMAGRATKTASLPLFMSPRVACAKCGVAGGRFGGFPILSLSADEALRTACKLAKLRMTITADAVLIDVDEDVPVPAPVAGNPR